MLDDPAATTRVRRLVLCSGKVYYDIVGHELREQAQAVAVARIEQLYPFPLERTPSSSRSYPQLEEVVWAQEEPQNMGAWRAIRHRLEESLPDGVPLRYVGRPWRASPSEGYPTAHLSEQDRIVREALTLSWFAENCRRALPCAPPWPRGSARTCAPGGGAPWPRCFGICRQMS